ncbi:MAG: DMT family transporter [Kofleriaceae bacterium]
MLSRGVVYMAASALGFSVMSVLVKVASVTIPTGEIVLSRAVVTLVLSYVLVVRAELRPWGNEKGRLILRGLLGFGGLTCYYGAIAHLPLADATTIQNTTPLLTAVLAWWILREQIGWPTAVALACGIGGVLMIVHPGGSGSDPVGLAFALGATTCSAIAYVTVRQLARTEHALVIVFYFPLVATPLAIPWAIADWVTPSPTEWLLLVAIGIATQIAQVFLTMGLSIERAGRATSVGYLQVIFAMIWQTVIFDDAPALLSIAGAALIVVGTLAVARTSKAAPPDPRATSTPRSA